MATLHDLVLLGVYSAVCGYTLRRVHYSSFLILTAVTFNNVF